MEVEAHLLLEVEMLGLTKVTGLRRRRRDVERTWLSRRPVTEVKICHTTRGGLIIDCSVGGHAFGGRGCGLRHRCGRDGRGCGSAAIIVLRLRRSVGGADIHIRKAILARRRFILDSTLLIAHEVRYIEPRTRLTMDHSSSRRIHTFTHPQTSTSAFD